MSNSIDDKFFLDADAFFTANSGCGLTYDDVSLATQYSDVLPRQTRLDTSLSDSIKLSIPMISSDMDTVTESQMAIGMARNGGLGLIHCNMTQKEQRSEVARVKNYIHGLIQDPIKVSPQMCIGDVLKIVAEKNFRRALMLSNGDYGVFFSRPLTVILFAVAIFSLVLPIIQGRLANRKQQASSEE